LIELLTFRCRPGKQVQLTE
jgi:serine/threonine-protein phosphatase PP1 catalytic subunit